LLRPAKQVTNKIQLQLGGKEAPPGKKGRPNPNLAEKTRSQPATSKSLAADKASKADLEAESRFYFELWRAAGPTRLITAVREALEALTIGENGPEVVQALCASFFAQICWAEEFVRRGPYALHYVDQMLSALGACRAAGHDFHLRINFASLGRKPDMRLDSDVLKGVEEATRMLEKLHPEVYVGRFGPCLRRAEWISRFHAG